MRLFISIEVPEGIKKKVGVLVEKFRKCLTPIKWVENKNLHVTLKFIGWVEDDKVEKLKSCVTESVKGVGPFEMSLAGIGMFPDKKHPRVIWVGSTKGTEKAKKLADKIERSVAGSGFREEEREFTSHLTIGRIKEKIDTEELSKCVSKAEKSEFGSFMVDHVSLMKSTLRRSGPIYEELEQIKL